MIFNYIQLRRFFRCIRDVGSTELFSNWRGNKVFLLRHDVDFDIRLARDLAVIEKEEGVVSRGEFACKQVAPAPRTGRADKFSTKMLYSSVANPPRRCAAPLLGGDFFSPKRG